MMQKVQVRDKSYKLLDDIPSEVRLGRLSGLFEGNELDSCQLLLALPRGENVPAEQDFGAFLLRRRRLASAVGEKGTTHQWIPQHSGKDCVNAADMGQRRSGESHTPSALQSCASCRQGGACVSLSRQCRCT